MQRNIVTLAAGRAAIGAGAYIAPQVTGRLFGLNPKANPQMPYIARLFGVRDVAIAVGLLASGPEQRSRWLLTGIMCDLGDAVAGVLAARDAELPKPAAALVTATALGGVGAGLVALFSGGRKSAGAEPAGAESEPPAVE